MLYAVLIELFIIVCQYAYIRRLRKEVKAHEDTLIEIEDIAISSGKDN